MQMPFKVWFDDIPTKIFLIRTKHSIYYRLEKNYFLIKKIALNNIESLNDLSLLLNYIREVLYIGYTQPICNRLYTTSFDFEKLFSILNETVRLYPEISKQCKEISLLLKKLQSISSTLVQATLEELFLNNIIEEFKNNEQYVFGLRFSSQANHINVSFLENGLFEFCKVYNWKEIVKEGLHDPLILAGPINWHSQLLIVPPAKNIVIIQPCWHSIKMPISDLFSLNDSISIGCYDPTIILEKQYILSIYEENILEDNDNNMDIILDETIENPIPLAKPKDELNINAKKFLVKVITGWIEVDPNEKYLIISQDKNIQCRYLTTPEQLDIGDFLVSIIEGPHTSSYVMNQSWQAEMEIWKKPLRMLKNQPNLLVKKLKALGADEKANETNVLNWMTASTHQTYAPQNLGKNFKAILTYARIPEEEHNYFMELISSIRGGSRAYGRLATADYYSKAVQEIEMKLESLNLEDDINLEISTNSYLYQLQKITDIDFFGVKAIT